MAGSGDPCRSAELTDLVGCITALEAAVIVALGQIALAGADTAEEANATLAELRTHCDQVREALRAAAEADGKLSGIPDQAFRRNEFCIHQVGTFVFAYGTKGRITHILHGSK